MEVTERGYARMTQILMEIAETTAQGKLAITLEGGYDVVGQKESVKAVLKELAQFSPLEKGDLLEKEEASTSRTERIVLQLKEIQRRFWKSL
jgi:acetoin utilization deacetylase AcuC-like enzyme